MRRLPGPLARAVSNAVLLVHHLLQQRLVVGIERSHGDVAHRTELAAVVQVLVLQTEEVPDKTPAKGEVDYCEGVGPAMELFTTSMEVWHLGSRWFFTSSCPAV